MAKDTDDLTEAEFVARFTAHGLKRCGFTHFDDGGSVEEYLSEVAKSYFADADRRDEGPEVCVEEDMIYWGEE